MISEQDAVLERARSYIRDRGWRHEPLTWEEVKVLVEAADNEVDDEDHVDCRQDAYDEGHGLGYDEGYEDAMAMSLDADAVVDWCSDNGYQLVKAKAS